MSGEQWTTGCAGIRLVPGRGVAVLLPGGEQVALFRLDGITDSRPTLPVASDGGVYAAVGNIDPFGCAAVMSRGLVGDRNGEPTVASPLLKQTFSLRDGRCLDDDRVRLPIYRTRVVDGEVQVAGG